MMTVENMPIAVVAIMNKNNYNIIEFIFYPIALFKCKIL